MADALPRSALDESPCTGRDVGPVHVVALNSYDNFVNHGDRLQRSWLEQDLSSVDRAATPWLIVMMHAPFYNSNSAHALEAELMRLTYEPLLLKYGVDVVLSGHVHAYERSDARGIYDAQPNACGPVYLNLGDGGNREGGEAAWVAPHPEWSAFRESSFGVGALDIINETHASYAWHRDACGAATAPHYDLAANDCATPHDAGGAPHVAIDAIVLRRDLRARLRRAPPSERTRRRSRPSPTAGARPTRRTTTTRRPIVRERRSVELSLVAIILGTAASFILGICAAATSRVTRRPSETSADAAQGTWRPC